MGPHRSKKGKEMIAENVEVMQNNIAGARSEYTSMYNQYNEFRRTRETLSQTRKGMEISQGNDLISAIDPVHDAVNIRNAIIELIRVATVPVDDRGVPILPP